MRLPIGLFPDTKAIGANRERPTNIAAFARDFAIPFSNSPLLLPDILAPGLPLNPPSTLFLAWSRVNYSGGTVEKKKRNY